MTQWLKKEKIIKGVLYNYSYNLTIILKEGNTKYE